jgi:patatin-like phospholipase/acyl hydrolase
MSDPYTLRILELDGGGERGYLSLNFLSQFVQLWGINPNELWKYFDVICGTSIGGMMALALAIGKSTDDLSPLFTTQGKLIFSTNGVPSNRATTFDKLYSIGVSGVPFYGTDPGTGYGSALLTSEIQSLFGTMTMQDLLTNSIIPTYKVEFKEGTTNIDTGVYTLCSNAIFSDFVGQNELISNVALVTSAAPFYLPSIVLNNTNPKTLSGRYIDGGVYQNNPASFGLNLAKMLKPLCNRACVLSIGTGLGEMGFNDDNSSLVGLSADPIISVSNLFSLFDISGTGGQESVAKNLYLNSTYTLDQLYYYRFQPILDLNQDTELDNTSDEILTYYEDTASTWFNEDEENIITFLGHLMA